MSNTLSWRDYAKEPETRAAAGDTGDAYYDTYCDTYYTDFAVKPVSLRMQRLTDWLTAKTGYQLDARSVSIACSSLRAEYASARRNGQRNGRSL